MLFRGMRDFRVSNRFYSLNILNIRLAVRESERKKWKEGSETFTSEIVDGYFSNMSERFLFFFFFFRFVWRTFGFRGSFF